MSACVYCLESGQLCQEQILCRGKEFYLCAPRGQLVEGYLAVAPYRCVRCLSMLPDHSFTELAWFRRLVGDFYADAYGAVRPMFYEQGRGGGGATAAATGFPLHAHLCALPIAADVARLFSSRYQPLALAEMHDLPRLARGEPYLYVESGGQHLVYLPRSAQDRAGLERMRLKPHIADLLGLPERGDWRAYPGDDELEHVIERFVAFSNRRAA